MDIDHEDIEFVASSNADAMLMICWRYADVPALIKTILWVINYIILKLYAILVI